MSTALYPFSTYVPRTSVFLLLSLCALPAFSQGSGAALLPEPLRNIRQADGVCKNDSPNPASAKPIATPASDAACMLPMASLDAFMQKNGALVVDVRGETQFNQFHIPNAMRMELAALTYKSHLRDKPLILVGNGRSERELYNACAQLRAGGFKAVHVAAGGMPAYVAADKTVSGRPPSALDLATLDAGQLAEEAQFQHNLLVMLGNMRVSDSLPYALALTDPTPEALSGLIDRRRKESKVPIASVVLVAASPLAEASYRQYLKAVRGLPLLTYTDGADVLAKFAVAQKATWAAHARGPKQPRCG